MYFKHECSYFWKLKPNFIIKSNIINKIGCILNVDVLISENLIPTLLKNQILLIKLHVF
jgi:hypothetical protein